MSKQSHNPAIGRAEGFLLVAGIALGIAAIVLAGVQSAVLTIAGTF